MAARRRAVGRMVVRRGRATGAHFVDFVPLDFGVFTFLHPRYAQQASALTGDYIEGESWLP